MTFRKLPCAVVVATVFLGLLFAAFSTRADDDDTFGGANIGERLFLDTRFAEFFFTNSGGDANALTDGNADSTLLNGDPVMNTMTSIYGPLPGPFAGQSMNCRECHSVEEQQAYGGNDLYPYTSLSVLPTNVSGNRTYCDFAQRSPVPDIGDGRTTTPRNAMPLVDAFLPRNTPLFLHFDGQFTSIQDLVVGTLTGRDFGWKPAEYETAIHHIAHIIRDDDGAGGLAQQYGGWSYTVAFEGLAEVESQYQIPPQNRMNVSVTDTNSPNYVSDEQIVQNVAALMEEYLLTLVFSQDTNPVTGNLDFNGSPYDVFLIKNGLPQEPAADETPLQYSQRLLRLITNLSNPQFVTDPADGSFMTQNQTFQFGTNELAGLKMFFALASSNAVQTGSEVGNCVACHTPPAFTDFIFHNTGAAQEEYDSIHGSGAFMALTVPGWRQRTTNYDAYLPPTTNHPDALGTFETPPTTNNPGQVDLGLWNVFANPDFPAPQAGLQQISPELVPNLSPQISRAVMNGGQFAFSGTNGPVNWTYYVLSSTNLTLPLVDWDVVATNATDSAGNFGFTNIVVVGASQKFYRMSMDTMASALPSMIALFKTPTVRDISSSEPYFHTGRMDTVEDVVGFYEKFSALARAGNVRNADARMQGISLDDAAVAPLSAFLRSLNEDYVDIPCPCQ